MKRWYSPLHAVSCSEGSRHSTGRIGLCILSAVIAGVWLFPAPGYAAKEKAPTTKTVSGKVLDKNDEGIGGAEVSLKDLSTGKSLSIYASPEGQYRFTELNPRHDYEVVAAFKGARSETRHVSSVDVRMRLTLNLTIPPLEQ